MAEIFDRLVQDKQAIIDAVVSVLQALPDRHDSVGEIRRIEKALAALRAKKDRLLEMSVEGVISMAEFKQRNDGFNEQAEGLGRRLAELQAEAGKDWQATARLEEVRAALEQELTFQNGIHSALVAAILDHIVVKKGSTKEVLHLDVHLKFGGPWEAVLDRKRASIVCVPT